MTYQQGKPPGCYEHRGLWCLRCGTQTSHYKTYGSVSVWTCCVCEHTEGEPLAAPEPPPRRPTPQPMPAVQAPPANVGDARAFFERWDEYAPHALAGAAGVIFKREHFEALVQERAKLSAEPGETP